MCCVYKAKSVRKQNYRRFDEGQFTKVGCKTNMLKQCIIIGYLGRIALSMMIGRAGGWMEWSGAVKGRAGVGIGVWGWEGRGGWGGEWPPSHFRLMQHHDGIVRLVCETRVFR